MELSRQLSRQLDEVIALLDVTISPGLQSIFRARKGRIEQAVFRDRTPRPATERCDPETWRMIRESVLRRDEFQCQGCTAGCTVLNVHHIIPVSDGGSDDPSNLITLCEDCHSQIHPWMQGESDAR